MFFENFNRNLLITFLFVIKTDRKKKESIFDLAKFIDKAVRVKFQGGREGMQYILIGVFFSS